MVRSNSSILVSTHLFCQRKTIVLAMERSFLQQPSDHMIKSLLHSLALFLNVGDLACSWLLFSHCAQGEQASGSFLSKMGANLDSSFQPLLPSERILPSAHGYENLQDIII